MTSDKERALKKKKKNQNWTPQKCTQKQQRSPKQCSKFEPLTKVE